MDVPGVPRFEVRPHHCFACGSLNTSGMGLVLHVEPRRCWTELTLEQRFEGWDGIAHGGILCTILDEVMAWSLVGEDNWGLTARINVEFKKPVEIGAADPRGGVDHELPPPDRRHGRAHRRPAHGRGPGHGDRRLRRRR